MFKYPTINLHLFRKNHRKLKQIKDQQALIELNDEIDYLL